MSRPLTATALEPGRELDGGKYRILRLLGSGGMGSVFEAEHTRTRKRVAIKCLHPSRTEDPEAVARFIREAEAAARVRHPNVVDVYDAGSDAGLVFLVMEYLEGEPLTHLLARGGVPVASVIALLLPAMRAVAAAHRQGVVHRDIKPDNIFLSQEADVALPVPKVLDFGISKLETASPEQQLTLTRSGSTLGTPRYMAYEQLIGDKHIDGRADVYAFGVILYEVLTGRLPYDAETYPELIVKIVTGPLVAPKELAAELPSALDRLVCWALQKDRAERIPNLETLIRELEPFATERGFRVEMTVSPTANTEAAHRGVSSTIRRKLARFDAPVRPRRGRARRLVLGAAGVGLLLIAIAAQRCHVATQAVVPPVAAPAEVERAHGPERAVEAPPPSAAARVEAEPVAPAPAPPPTAAPRKAPKRSASARPDTSQPAAALPPPAAVESEPAVKPAQERGPESQFRVKLPQSKDF